MIKKKEELTVKINKNDKGGEALIFENLAEFEGMNPKVRMFSTVKILPGEEVSYHMHMGEFESYYILSGMGVYNDNGQLVDAEPGMITFTPSGSGHGLKNTGDEILEFIALIIED